MEWLWRGCRKYRHLALEDRSLCHCPNQAEKGLLLLLCVIKPGARGRIISLGQESVHFQFIYVCYPQGGINDCETDLIFMSTLRPGFDMNVFPVHCALRAICFSGRGDRGKVPSDYILTSE